MDDADEGLTRARLTFGRPHLTLAVILAAGFAIRLLYLLIVVRTPGFHWEDPDGYLANALLLVRADGWHWSFDVAKYTAHGQVYALPPLYSVFLSLIALFPGLPFSAQLAQTALSTMAIGLVFMLGRMLHSSATGLWACAAYAASVSSIFNVWSTSQETLYIPLLLLAFVLYARALTREARTEDSRLTTRDSRLTTRDSRLTTRDPRLGTRDPRLGTHDSRLATHDSRLATRDSRLTTRDSRLGTPLRLASPAQCSDWRH